MKILIAEDEISTAKALKVILEKSKFSVDIVHNGNDAWSYIQAGPYEVIVLDIMMPGMSGLEVLAKLRANNIKTPVLMLTAKGELEDRVAGLEAGADDYLPKPFATAELIARVKASIISISRIKYGVEIYKYLLALLIIFKYTFLPVLSLSSGESS